MANKTVITNKGMSLMANSTASTGSQYWIGFYSLAYVPWKDGTVDEPEVSTSMTRLTTYGDEIYNVFQGDLTSDGFAGENPNFGYSHYDGNLLRNYRYVRRADGRNALVTWVNSGSKSIAGAVVYSGATQTSDSSGSVVNITSGMPLPAPLYYMNPTEDMSTSADFVNALLYPAADTSVLSNLNRLTDSSGSAVVLPMISTDFRDYAVNGSVIDPTAHSSSFYSSPLTDDFAWYSSAATRTEDSDSTYNNQWNRYCDEFWKLQSISRYNRYHSPVNSNGIVVDYDTACRNMSKVTKYFPIDSYSVSGSKIVGDHEYATAIRLGIHLDVSRSLTAANTENYFDLTQTGTSSILDMSGNDLFRSNSVSFKFNRIGVYAVPMRQVTYRAAEEISNVKVEYQIDADAEPVLFAVVDFDSAEIMSNDGDGNVTFEAELEVNLLAASDDSSIIRDTAVFYNRIEDDAGNWYKNQLIANASICEAVTQQGIEISHLAQTAGGSSSQSGAGKCCNRPDPSAYASKNHTHKFLINFEDGSVVNDYGVRGRDTLPEGKMIPSVINPVQITSVTDAIDSAKSYSVYHSGNLLWTTEGYNGDGQNPSGVHYYRYGATLSSYPSGWRLPSKAEFYALLDSIKTARGLASRELALPYALASDGWTGLTAYGSTLALKPNGYVTLDSGVYNVIGVGTSLVIQTSDDDKPLITITYADGALSIVESDFPVGTTASLYTVVIVKSADPILDLSGKYMLGKYSFCYGDGTMCAGDRSTVSGKDSYVSSRCSLVDVVASTGTSVYDSYVGADYWGQGYDSVKKTSSTNSFISGCDDCYFDTVGYSAFIGCRNTSAYDVESSLVLGLGYSGLYPGYVRSIHSMIVLGDYMGNYVHDCSGGFVGGESNAVSFASRSLVLGMANSLYMASDSAISGYGNYVRECGYLGVAGSFNNIVHAGNSTVTGEHLSLYATGDSLALGFGNTYNRCGQSVLGGFCMYAGDPTGGIGSSVVLGGYVRIVRLESSIISIGGYGAGPLCGMSSWYPVSGETSGDDFMTFYTVESAYESGYYANPYGNGTDYIRYINDVTHSLMLGPSMVADTDVNYVAALGESLYIHHSVRDCVISASHSSVFDTASYSLISGYALYIGNGVSYCLVASNYTEINACASATYGIISGDHHRIMSGSAYFITQGSYNTISESSMYATVLGNRNTVTNGSLYTLICGNVNTVTDGASHNTVLGDSTYICGSSSYNLIVGTNSYLCGTSTSYVSVNGTILGSYVCAPSVSTVGFAHLIVGNDWNSASGEHPYGDAFISVGANAGGGRISTGTIQLGRGTENGGLILGGGTTPANGYVLGVVNTTGKLAEVGWVPGGSGVASCEYLCQSVNDSASTEHFVLTANHTASWSESGYAYYCMQSAGYAPYVADTEYVQLLTGTYRVDWSVNCPFAVAVLPYSNFGSVTFYGIVAGKPSIYTSGCAGSFIAKASQLSNMSMSATGSGVCGGSSVFITKL